MPSHYYHKHHDNDGLLSLLLLIAIGSVIALYNKVTTQMIDSVITGGLLLAGLALALVLFIHYKRSRFEERRLRALRFVDLNYMDGLAFEKYVAKLLKNQGYTKVSLTETYDLGIDIIAARDGIRWGVQVKRYSNMVGAEAVRQVVTALNKYGCQRAMVVTNSTFSRPAKILAQTNNCVLIGRDELAEWVVSFQSQV